MYIKICLKELKFKLLELQTILNLQTDLPGVCHYSWLYQQEPGYLFTL